MSISRHVYCHAIVPMPCPRTYLCSLTHVPTCYSIALVKVCSPLAVGNKRVNSNRLTFYFLQNEIRIVQASLLGSILANLLLILGMSFLLGGLRFREQVSIFPMWNGRLCPQVLTVILDLQQHSDPDECLPAKFERH